MHMLKHHTEAPLVCRVGLLSSSKGDPAQRNTLTTTNTKDYSEKSVDLLRHLATRFLHFPPQHVEEVTLPRGR